MNCEVLSRHLILALIVEHAGRLMSRYQVGRDGRTACELHAGQPYCRQLVNWIPSGKVGSQVAGCSMHRYQRPQ